MLRTSRGRLGLDAEPKRCESGSAEIGIYATQGLSPGCRTGGCRGIARLPLGICGWPIVLPWPKAYKRLSLGMSHDDIERMLGGSGRTRVAVCRWLDNRSPKVGIGTDLLNGSEPSPGHRILVFGQRGDHRSIRLSRPGRGQAVAWYIGINRTSDVDPVARMDGVAGDRTAEARSTAAMDGVVRRGRPNQVPLLLPTPHSPRTSRPSPPTPTAYPSGTDTPSSTCAWGVRTTPACLELVQVASAHPGREAFRQPSCLQATPKANPGLTLR